MLRAEGLSTSKGPQIYLLGPPSRGQCLHVTANLSTMKTPGRGSGWELTWALQGKSGASGLRITCVLVWRIPSLSSRRRRKTVTKLGRKEEGAQGERDGEEEEGLSSGLRAMLDCGRDRKRLRELGPWGLNREAEHNRVPRPSDLLASGKPR